MSLDPITPLSLKHDEWKLSGSGDLGESVSSHATRGICRCIDLWMFYPDVT